MLTSTELCQLSKSPILIQHYTEHKAADKSISFFGFLKIHYFNGNPHDADYDRDMQLPFKTSSAALIASNSFSISLFTQILTLPIPVVNLRTYLKGYSFFIPKGGLSYIFQPPRIS